MLLSQDSSARAGVPSCWPDRIRPETAECSALATTASSRFRNPNDISFISVARHRSYARGMAVQGYVSHRFFPFERDLSEYTRESLPALFCLNAGLGDETLREKRILARLFPTPAAFELPAAVPST